MSVSSLRKKLHSTLSQVISQSDHAFFLNAINQTDKQNKTLSDYAQLFRTSMEQQMAVMLGSNQLDQTYAERLVVLDGALLTPLSFFSPIESQNLTKATLCGVAKTSDLLSDSGEPALYASYEHMKKKIGPSSSGCLFPLFETETGVPLSGILKLHPHAQDVFRVDTLLGKDIAFSKLAGNLLIYSNDPIFIGYPYPLIEIDKHARVSNVDAERIKTHLFMELQKNGLDNLISFELSSNAHSILDSLEF